MTRLGALSVDGSVAAMLAGDGSGILVDTRRPPIAAEIRLPFRDATKVAVHSGGTLLAVARTNVPVDFSLGFTGQHHAGDLPMDRTQAVHVLRFSRDGQQTCSAFAWQPLFIMGRNLAHGTAGSGKTGLFARLISSFRRTAGPSRVAKTPDKSASGAWKRAVTLCVHRAHPPDQ
jgi:hypothetical protein